MKGDTTTRREYWTEHLGPPIGRAGSGLDGHHERITARRERVPRLQTEQCHFLWRKRVDSARGQLSNQVIELQSWFTRTCIPCSLSQPPGPRPEPGTPVKRQDPASQFHRATARNTVTPQPGGRPVGSVARAGRGSLRGRGSNRQHRMPLPGSWVLDTPVRVCPTGPAVRSAFGMSDGRPCGSRSLPRG